MTDIITKIKDSIQDIPHFPKEGVMFKDIMPIFSNAKLFKETIQYLAHLIQSFAPTHLVGIESRGFLFAAPLAYELSCAFVPARKKGKLPGEVVSQTYTLEYGTDTLQIQKSSLTAGAKYFIVDDVLATGGTAFAVNELLTQENCQVVGNLFLIELEFLLGRDKLKQRYKELPILSCLKY